ncbi:MAG: histidine phosphatase family protein [Actinomycetota bacterium]|nr:histidine phosphatase family protein [Actinomycetota bacterium]
MTHQPTTGPTTVHLVRHGEVDNPGGVLYGRLPNYHLSERGRAMAEVVADHLAGRDIALVTSSPMERAQETAAPIAERHGLPVGLDDDLIEAGNHFQGLRFGVGDGSLRHPRHWPRLVNPFRPSWGEPYAEVVTRMMRAVMAATAAARSAGPGREAVLVSHQLPVWETRLHLEGRRLWHDPRRRECSLCSVTSLTYDGDRLLSLSYAEPAAALLPGAGTVAGA